MRALLRVSWHAWTCLGSYPFTGFQTTFFLDLCKHEKCRLEGENTLSLEFACTQWLTETRAWMKAGRLRLHPDRTEVIVVGCGKLSGDLVKIISGEFACHL